MVSHRDQRSTNKETSEKRKKAGGCRSGKQTKGDKKTFFLWVDISYKASQPTAACKKQRTPSCTRGTKKERLPGKPRKHGGRYGKRPQKAPATKRDT